ncbi:protein-tyrosine phosphatase-like protein [Lasiosphaeria miniovina]|uniref:Protein-tyrosine phosphatase-like protein n=1 Tax=Lasiosphaeria miniovina TaxID=1954250 RepID=A0AA40AVL1_9PEZI|nr:protein-tyrosine phosphatase-like protein [Lasiosphaeria miniovina]KAK0722759.1 protein-tyrosine phosphatase-like protein [Lasiosphaeria miniovina]
MAAPHNKHIYSGIHALRGGKPELGDLALNDFHLVFRFPPESAIAADPELKKRVKQAWFAFHVIAQCTLKATPPSSGIPSSIRIRFRDFTYVSFNFADDKQARDAYDFIRSRTCRLGSVDKLLAFSYSPPHASPEYKISGWDVYDARAEFRRQGISEKAADLGWRITSINADYSFSPTYPAVLAVPSKISDNTLKYAANFRSRARVPTLSYLHPVNNCTITRSSQPFVGLRMKRSIQDERLVGACFSAASDLTDTPPSAIADQSPSSSHVDLSAESADADMSLSETERREDELITGNAFYDEKTGKRLIYGAQQNNLIVDARPAINSYAMQAIGMGSENMDYYRFARKVFLNIDNIHVMRESLEKVVTAIKDADVSPFPPNKELLAKSKWLKHITGILDGSAIIARQVSIQHSHVLIHCSDGWDRTSQLSALAQLMLDPYYRTLEGFIVLVEKDWLSFGHMFQLRSGHLSHESWFTADNDALAGSTVKPGDNDGRGDAIENALASAKRFWIKNVSNDKDNSSEADDASAVDEAKQETVPVAEGQATRLKDVSPVFHQFLDATYQLLRQHPTRFEFNERFLRRLLYHVYSCQYGTFLYNNERQRREAKLQERTRSVWAYFLSRCPEFTNGQYDATIDDHTKGRERLIFPRLGEVRWWHQVFNRTDDEMNGDLNASAATAERVAAYASQTSSTLSESPHFGGDDMSSPPERDWTSPTRSPQPPTLKASQSVLAGVELAHEALTPETRSPPSLNRSASAGEVPGALAVLQDKISGLGITKGVFGGASSASNGRNRHRRLDPRGKRRLLHSS